MINQEILNLEKRGFVKVPLIVRLLTEAKNNGYKWIFQSGKENFYPLCKENQNPEGYDDWIYTDDIEGSLKEYVAYDETYILMDNGGWIRWIHCNGNGLDALCDFSTDLSHFIEPLCDHYENVERY